MSKLKLDMTISESVIAMGEGIPGALKVLSDSLDRNGEIDPDNAFGSWGLIANLDHLEIYGERIWILYKDVCGESLTRTAAMARACQLGIISREQLDLAIEGKETLPIEEITRKVKEELPNFRA